ncbi:MAG: 4'-phosphopantetheinyl transferase family protein [Cellvibrionaceae bacterium]
MTFDNLKTLHDQWVICAPLSTVVTETMYQWLSDEEVQRANRFRRPEDSQRFILAHVMKRFYLSQLLDLRPEALQFVEGPKGKPFCTDNGAPFFNISHSGDWVLLAVSSTKEIGVDVECSKRGVSEGTMNHVLTSSQLEKVNASNNPQATFITYWTQKEAVSKALGLGLSIDFTTIDCSGDIGSSRVIHSGNELKVSAHIVDDSHIASVSVLAHSQVEPIPLYVLADWRGLHPLLVSLS